MKVFLLIECAGGSESVLKAFSSDEKAQQGKRQAQIADKRRVKELMTDPCKYRIAQIELE